MTTRVVVPLGKDYSRTYRDDERDHDTKWRGIIVKGGCPCAVTAEGHYSEPWDHSSPLLVGYSIHRKRCAN